MAFVSQDYALDNVVTALLALAAALPNMVATITDSTEQKLDASRFPFAVANCLSARPTLEAGALTTLATFGCQIHTSPWPALQAEWNAARPYSVAFCRALLADPTLGKKLSAITEVRARYGTLQYPEGVETLGWSIEIEAKLSIAL